MIDFKESQIVDINLLYANDYNPNRMPDIEMQLLKECIEKYGFLFPIIVNYDDKLNKYRIIDGYHRYETLRRLGATEVSIINLDIPYHDCMKLTVLMNRIKGMHQVESMSHLIKKLKDLGLEDKEIQKQLGMEKEEITRLMSQIGIAEAFKHHEYSKSWEVEIK